MRGPAKCAFANLTENWNLNFTTINALHLDANVGYRTIDDDDDTHHAHIQTQKHTHASLHTYNGMCGVHIHTQRA